MAQHESKESAPSTIGTVVFLTWGLIVWGLQLTAVYVGHTWLCAMGAPRSMVNMLIVVLVFLSAAAILPAVLAPSRMVALAGLKMEEDNDVRSLLLIVRLIAVLSLVAVLWTGSTAVFVQACEAAR